MKKIRNELIKKRRKHYQFAKAEKEGSYLHGYHSGMYNGLSIAIKMLKEESPNNHPFIFC